MWSAKAIEAITQATKQGVTTIHCQTYKYDPDEPEAAEPDCSLDAEGLDALESEDDDIKDPEELAELSELVTPDDATESYGVTVVVKVMPSIGSITPTWEFAGTLLDTSKSATPRLLNSIITSFSSKQ